MPSIELNDLDYLILKGIADLNKMTVNALVQNAISKLISERIDTADYGRECQNSACLKRFNTTQYQRKYCSKACANHQRREKSKIRRRKEKRTATCSECGKTFHTNHDAIRTCSKICKQRRSNRMKREDYQRNYAPRPPDLLTCIICHHDFETLNRNTKMCSAKCRRTRRVQLETAKEDDDWSSHPRRTRIPKAVTTQVGGDDKQHR